MDVSNFNIIEKKTENLENDIKDNNNNGNNKIYLDIIKNSPCLKLCILEGSFWFSEESERVYIFICLLFFEYSEYIHNYFYKNFVNKNHSSKNKSLNNTNNNISICFCIYFIISQKIILIINHLFYLLIQHSYSTNSARTQQQKFIYISQELSIIVPFITKYRFSFILAGFLLKKNFYDINKVKNEFSMYFIIQKIIFYLRLNYVIIFLFYNLLINIKDEEFLYFIDYYFVDFFIIIFDYLVVILSLIF